MTIVGVRCDDYMRSPPLGGVLRTLTRHRVSPTMDGVLRPTACVGIAAIPVMLLVPSAAEFLPLVLSTLWMRGPLSALFPVGLEPILMAYGATHSVWVVTAVAAGASAFTELISLHLMRGVAALPRLDGLRGKVMASRVMRLFDRHPMIAIGLTAMSPVPDWITRSLASASRYSVTRYVIADTVGRIPKLFIPIALGSVFHLPASWIAGGVIGSLVLAVVIAVARWMR